MCGVLGAALLLWRGFGEVFSEKFGRENEKDVIGRREEHGLLEVIGG